MRETHFSQNILNKLIQDLKEVCIKIMVQVIQEG